MDAGTTPAAESYFHDTDESNVYNAEYECPGDVVGASYTNTCTGIPVAWDDAPKNFVKVDLTKA